MGGNVFPVYWLRAAECRDAKRLDARPYFATFVIFEPSSETPAMRPF